MSPARYPISHDELAAHELLLKAIERGELARVRELVTAHSRLPSLRLAGAQNPLARAAARGRHAIVELLIKRGAPLDATPQTAREHALYAALENGHLAMARCVAGYGASLDSVLEAGFRLTPLWAAAFEREDDGLFDFLVGHSRELRDPAPSFRDGICEAARAPRAELLSTLLDAARTTAGVFDDIGSAPLQVALAERNARAARLLLARGVRLGPSSFLEAKRLWPAVLRHGDEALAALILEAGFDLEAWETEHGSLLARWPEGSVKTQPVLKLLIEHGLDPNASAPGYGTPAYAALAAGRVTLYRFLLEHGAELDRDTHRALPFFLSAGALALEEDELRHLIACGHDINTRDRDDRGVLQHAVDSRASGATLERLHRLGAAPR